MAWDANATNARANATNANATNDAATTNAATSNDGCAKWYATTTYKYANDGAIGAQCNGIKSFTKPGC